jgi:hypothetical protein
MGEAQICIDIESLARFSHNPKIDEKIEKILQQLATLVLF